MSFNRSLVQRLRYRPWRWQIPPATQELQGVFILLSDELVELLATNLTQVEKDELRQWIHRVDENQAAEWHVPVWAGHSSAVYIRVPAVVWNDPDGIPPPKVKRYFQQLWREVEQ